MVDEASRKLIDNVTKEDDILNENVTGMCGGWVVQLNADYHGEILQIEDQRQMSPDMDAVYLLSPLPHIVDCLLADFGRRRYRRVFLVWTSRQSPVLE